MNHNKKKQIKQYIFVIKELTGRELKRKYSRSKLGVLWSVLNPLLSMIIVSMIYGQMFRRAIENFPIYYLCGSTMWSLFTTSTDHAMTALVDNKMMLIKVKIPMQVFIVSRVYTAFVNYIYSLIAFIPILIVYRIQINFTILFLPVVVFFEILFSLGVSQILSVGYVFFGDIKYLYGIALSLLMHFSAIFYSIDNLSGIIKTLVANNPVYLFIDGMRWIVLEGTLQPWRSFFKMVFWSVTVYLMGMLIFRKNRNQIMQKL